MKKTKTKKRRTIKGTLTPYISELLGQLSIFMQNPNIRLSPSIQDDVETTFISIGTLTTILYCCQWYNDNCPDLQLAFSQGNGRKLGVKLSTQDGSQAATYNCGSDGVLLDIDTDAGADALNGLLKSFSL